MCCSDLGSSLFLEDVFLWDNFHKQAKDGVGHLFMLKRIQSSRLIGNRQFEFHIQHVFEHNETKFVRSLVSGDDRYCNHYYSQLVRTGVKCTMAQPPPDELTPSQPEILVASLDVAAPSNSHPISVKNCFIYQKEKLNQSIPVTDYNSERTDRFTLQCVP
ncbi:unnamed protein product [Rotaria socialis]|uniref:Uncharacterized protein n=1 Tax=Rotaria socialis TaxID=392032 RepID=A0A818VTY7_9BILA|nr:unnamed protein product [Rotaria socialis]